MSGGTKFAAGVAELNGLRLSTGLKAVSLVARCTFWLHEYVKNKVLLCQTS